MHLLLIHQAFTLPTETGGTRHYEFGRRLAAQGHRMTVVTADVGYMTHRPVSGRRRLVSEESMDGIRVIRIYIPAAGQHGFTMRVMRFMWFMLASSAVALRVRGVDLVMGTSPPIFQAVGAWLVSFVRRRPFLLEIRDLWPDFAVDMGILRSRLLIAMSRWLERFLYRRARHVVVNSPAYLDHVRARTGGESRLTLIANGVDTGFFECSPEAAADYRSRLGLQGKFVVTYAGAMGLANHLDTLVAAAVELQADPTVHLLLVGDGSQRPHLEAAVNEAGLANVTFVGAIPKIEMPVLLAASDACVATLQDIPMFRMTYPNKVFDYMAAGRPTILAIDGVIREVMEASGGGVCVQPGDAHALAQAVLTLAHAPDRARAMGASARDYVARNFRRSEQADAFRAVCEALCSARSSDDGA